MQQVDPYSRLNMRQVKFLFYSGKGLFGSIIRWRTWGTWSHVAIHAGSTYEALVKKGVVKHHKVEADLILNFNVSNYRFEKLKEWLDLQVGKKYDLAGVFGFIARTKTENPDRWFCSELAAAAMEHIKHPLLKLPPRKVSPSLLAASPMLWE